MPTQNPLLTLKGSGEIGGTGRKRLTFARKTSTLLGHPPRLNIVLSKLLLRLARTDTARVVSSIEVSGVQVVEDTERRIRLSHDAAQRRLKRNLRSVGSPRYDLVCSESR
jgi:hypothetical protein